MAMYVLASPGGAPGVTTTALALALTWPRPVIVAECDPACGDILAGLFAGHLAAPRGLTGVAFEAGRGAAAVAAEVVAQLAPLDDSGSRTFLAGISDPRQAPRLAPAWPAIARALASQAADVLADCGRLDAGDGQPASVLTEATAVLMVLRPTLRQVAGARPRIEHLAELLGGTERIGLLLVGDQGHEPKEITAALGVPVVATLPVDAKTAGVLSDGQGQRVGLGRRPLLRAARTAGAAIRRTLAPGRAAEPARAGDLGITGAWRAGDPGREGGPSAAFPADVVAGGLT
ncbi:MAG TPA: hypothetical protein VF834_11165 [Streptosporangiaceae bacterium]